MGKVLRDVCRFVAFEALYTEGSAVQAAFLAFVRGAVRGLSPVPGIVAWELINEPWAGDVFAAPWLLLPGVADRARLALFYRLVSAAVRGVESSTHLVLYAPVTWDDVTIGFRIDPTIGPPGTSALAVHYYSPPALPVPATQFAYYGKAALSLATGLLLTEFEMGRGGTAPSGRWSPRGVPAVNRSDVVSVANQGGVSWMGWDALNATGHLWPDLRGLMGSVHAVAVGGWRLAEGIVYGGNYTLTYAPSERSGPTILYVGARPLEKIYEEPPFCGIRVVRAGPHHAALHLGRGSPCGEVSVTMAH